MQRIKSRIKNHQGNQFFFKRTEPTAQLKLEMLTRKKKKLPGTSHKRSRNKRTPRIKRKRNYRVEKP